MQVSSIRQLLQTWRFHLCMFASIKGENLNTQRCRVE
jgi:hypothetical protein